MDGNSACIFLLLGVSMKTFIEWKEEGYCVRRGERGAKGEDGKTRFRFDQVDEIPGDLYDDLGIDCTEYDGDGR